MTAQHSDQLPECKLRFERVDEIRDDVKALRHALLGNGEEGMIHAINRRVYSLEQWQTEREKLEATLEGVKNEIKAEIAAQGPTPKEPNAAAALIAKITLAAFGLIGGAFAVIKIAISGEP